MSASVPGHGLTVSRRQSRTHGDVESALSAVSAVVVGGGGAVGSAPVSGPRQ